MKHVRDFFVQGLLAAPFGPLVLAVIYLILGRLGEVDVLAVDRIATEILTVTLLAFIAGGIPATVYRIERLPLPIAILIHAAFLYLDYAIVYLFNGWIDFGTVPFAVFSVCFFVGFALVWLGIFLINRRNARRLCRMLCERGE